MKVLGCEEPIRSESVGAALLVLVMHDGLECCVPFHSSLLEKLRFLALGAKRKDSPLREI